VLQDGRHVPGAVAALLFDEHFYLVVGDAGEGGTDDASRTTVKSR
jgi:hypothetical protein